jgi:hypothetical protein
MMWRSEGLEGNILWSFGVGVSLLISQWRGFTRNGCDEAIFALFDGMVLYPSSLSVFVLIYMTLWLSFARLTNDVLTYR